ncbi:Pseudouridine synthase, catalytic domain superfamily [Sesbania bispinosa]|nr:Pseudouridine synthase, catalytic domain superfamily [Sesbania bispinosa]
MSCAVAALVAPSSSPSSLLSLNSAAPAEVEHGVKPIQDGYKWRMVLAYDGTQYAELSQLILENVVIIIVRQTDAGVHAWGQVAHFFTPFNYNNLEEIHAALNGLLPPDIRVREISPASAEFHARFSAK